MEDSINHLERIILALKKIKIIQGGMGVAVSLWKLVRAVATRNQLGVISCTELAQVFFTRVKQSDPHTLETLKNFKDQNLVNRVLQYIKEIKQLPMPGYPSKDRLVETVILATYCEVSLAKANGGLVGINLLTKVQFLIAAHIYGAMLAGVDVVIMGAGIPRQIPALLDQLAKHEKTVYKIEYAGKKLSYDLVEVFDPSLYVSCPPPVFRPFFFMIVSSVTLAKRYLKIVDGFIFEGPTAGGHNAPPQDHDQGYTDKDTVKIKDLDFLIQSGKPFYMAGGYATPEGLREATNQGAWGIQAGSIFALCNESGIQEVFKALERKFAYLGMLKVETDFGVSPTGFPFQVPKIPGTASDEKVLKARCRNCNKGWLRVPIVDDDDKFKLYCLAEPFETLKRKIPLEGKTLTAAKKAGCLCNMLLEGSGYGTLNHGSPETPIATIGKDTSFVHHLMKSPDDTYSAGQAIDYLLSMLPNEMSD